VRSKYEILAQKELEKEGWKVDNKAGMGRWSKNRDFWNLFDLVALKDGEGLRWISIKGVDGGFANAKTGENHREDLKAFRLPEGNIKELWWWSKSKKDPGWRKIIIP